MMYQFYSQPRCCLINTDLCGGGGGVVGGGWDGGLDGCCGIVGLELTLLQLFLHEDQLLLVLLVLLRGEHWTNGAQVKMVQMHFSNRGIYSPLKVDLYHLSNDKTMICKLKKPESDKATSKQLSAGVASVTSTQFCSIHHFWNVGRRKTVQRTDEALKPDQTRQSIIWRVYIPWTFDSCSSNLV